MSKQELATVAKAMVAPGKGLLAMDESNRTCNKRLEDVGIAPTVESRRAYRELILTTPGLGTSISGAILYDETIRQAKKDGTPFIKVMTNAGIIPGIKVDPGAKDLAGHPDEKITEGLDAHLNAMNGKFGSRIPWPLTFSYARAIQQPALQLWQGLDANAKITQDALLYRAKCNSAARQGKYREEMEHAEPALVGSEGLHSHLSSQD
jgi:fructose-bisphosphate aldolase class 1